MLISDVLSHARDAAHVFLNVAVKDMRSMVSEFDALGGAAAVTQAAVDEIFFPAGSTTVTQAVQAIEAMRATIAFVDGTDAEVLVKAKYR